MKMAIKIFTGLVGLFVLINGLAFMFKPELVMIHSAIDANNAFGMSTIRGLIGGSMLAAAFLTLQALIKSKPELLYPAALILLGWTLGRIVSLITDGFHKGVLTSGVMISLVMAVILLIARKKLSENSIEQ